MSVRLLHLSDPHFGGENAAAVDGAIASAQAFAPSLIVVTGDLTLGGRRREFAMARDWLRRLPGTVLATPGNHDLPVWNVPLRLAAPFSRYRRYIGAIEEAGFESPDLIAYPLNTARGSQPRLNWSHGAIHLDQIKPIAARMATASGSLKVVACHHPLLEIHGAPVSGGVRGGRIAAEALAVAGVELILTGHLHIPHVLALPFGTGRTYQCGAGTLSGRTRGAPAGFSLIEAEERAIRITAFQWGGPEFEPVRTWTLDRATPSYLRAVRAQ